VQDATTDGAEKLETLQDATNDAANTVETVQDATSLTAQKVETGQGAKDAKDVPAVNVITTNKVGINIGASTGSSMPSGRGNYSMPSSAGSTFSAAPGKYGSPICPCIGFDGVKGTIDFGKTAAVNGAQVKGEEALVWKSQQNADYGAHCEGWVRPKKAGGDHQSSNKWCFIDPYNCDWNALPDVPKKSLVFPEAKHQGHDIFYSYATCGSTDDWTEANNEDACPMLDEEACAKNDRCAKLKDHGLTYTGSSKKVTCLAKDLLHKDKKKISAGQDLGRPSCPCIGFSAGANFREYDVTTGKTSEPFKIQGRTGATCGAWDIDQNPLCKGEEGKKPGRDWCQKKWCYVDGCNCKGLLSPPKVTTYFREGGSYQGHTLYYSYFTCAEDGKDNDETNTYTTAEYAPNSCFVQTSEELCASAVTGGKCTWVPPVTSEGKGKCTGSELVDKSKCNLS